jgi:transcriptional regulator with XRE-family HTH domain
VQKIKDYRKANNWNQEQLAVRVGRNRSTIAKWESGKAQPSLKYLIILAGIFNCRVDDLIKEEECEKA